MSFAQPQFFWLLLAIPPALILFFWWSWRTRQKLMAQFIQARLLPGLVAGVSASRQKVRAACLIAAVICLIITLARPQWGYVLQEAKQRGLDIVVAIDTSKSMLAEDIAPNRLTRAKLAALDLMQQAKSDRLGLVAFAGSAYLQCPLTIDDVAFRQSVEALDVNTLPDGGTALAEAIETALKTFKEEDNHKVLVLFTDGEDHDSNAASAAKRAADAGMKIFTIGIGSVEGELLRIRGADGQSDFVRDEQGNVVKSHLNEKLLKEIAEATPGGFYLPLRGANTMDILYQRGLAPLPKSDSKEKWMKVARDRYHWPLALAIVLLVVEALFPERKREPGKSARSALAKSSLAQATLWLCLLLPVAAFASPSSALREYQAGQYHRAQTEYERLLDKDADKTAKAELLDRAKKKYEENKPEEAEALFKQYLEKAGAGTGRLNFNAGAAAYKAGDLENAAMHFMAATTDPDWKLQEQALYNLGNTLYQSGERESDTAEKMSQWTNAVESFKAAMGLDPQDQDARSNREFVEKKLEELRKQQQQQQQNKDNKDSKPNDKQDQQNQQDQPDQQNKDQQNKKDQDSKSGSQDSKNQKPDPSQSQQQAKNQDPSEQKKNDQKQSSPDHSSPEKKDQPQKPPPAKGSPEPQPKDQNPEEPPESSASYAPGQMTPQQARRLLDGQKDDEMMLPAKPEHKTSAPSGPVKDW